jgi:hypothetical protein
MEQRKKNVGKGHTFYDFDLPKRKEDVWILIAESCYEISKTLIAEGSYARSLSFSMSGYDQSSCRGGYTLSLDGFPRYPSELFSCLMAEEASHTWIQVLLKEARRLWVRVECQPYIEPLFKEASEDEQVFDLMEAIRKKVKASDAIGKGFEGLRYARVQTYTPKRSAETDRAHQTLQLKPHLWKMYIDR